MTKTTASRRILLILVVTLIAVTGLVFGVVTAKPVYADVKEIELEKTEDSDLWSDSDLTFIVDFGISLWMYASPVVYPLSQLNRTGVMYKLMMLNPMAMPLELMRFILLGQGTITLSIIISSVAITGLVLIFGILGFNKVEKSFIDTI